MPLKNSIDMSLRLWSKDVELKTLLEGYGETVECYHSRGRPILSKGSATNRIADWNYAVTNQARGGSEGDVDAWIVRVLGSLEKQPLTLRYIQTGYVKGTVWIAILRSCFVSEIRFNSGSLNELEALGLEVLVEDYNSADESGAPSKRWLRPTAA